MYSTIECAVRYEVVNSTDTTCTMHATLRKFERKRKSLSIHSLFSVIRTHLQQDGK